ncbi:Ral GTPase-activating protein subunit alpha-2 [Cryptotermes secundus]|uniref:Ral GTPase-activating protein subunit alpha-2 n=1 Tax=Cryptotermes secundus TaxID=105785 RepID=A0A2J7QNM6_9NEOP|nr:probable Rho GTPase-activating protein CG5521 isoform X3 [Cryptotermes secundus]PNF30190.1 Ral GTPase-activating protein subunit alpha-2 [Cryptotermes secundus]
MFSKKLHADVKKSTLKIQDLKKDSATRLKHLKIILENVDAEEAKSVFESNFSHIYYILYDTFVTAEANLRQRVHKAHREELECVLQVLEKVLVYLPELLSRRWQCHSLTRIMTKLLHPGNSWKLRREAIRYFLLWYQSLADNSPEALHAIFATLVPGFPSPFAGQGLSALNRSSTSVFHDISRGPVNAVEIQPLLPPQSGEKQPDDPMRYFLDALLEFIVSQVTKIEWRDRLCKQHKCFVFLFERFKQYYLPHIFPQFSFATSLYKPVLDLPVLRKGSPGLSDTPEGRRRQDPFVVCRVVVIKWVATFTHITKKGEVPFMHTQSNSSVTPSEDTDHSPGTELRRVSVSQAGSNHDAASPASDSNHSSVFSQSEGGNHSLSEDPNAAAMHLVCEVLYSSRENVNFVHEVYRQAFLLNFTHSPAIRKAIAVYKDWIQMNVPELPSFMLEPLESHKEDIYRSGPPSYEYSSMESSEAAESYRVTRLRNDSYLGAIHKENLLVRAGLQNVLQVFITHAANVFMLEVSPEYPLLLEEQVDTCKRVLNIYRYMVMHTRMESRTWEQLLMVLLQITSLILSKTPPKRKEETLGGKLAPAIFQTLIVTWIKANLNVIISPELWDRFLVVLSSLTQWEELIREWAKTLETLTRVLARHVYNLDLNDLPLDRLTEQKAKKRRGGKQQGGDQPQASFSSTGRRGSEISSQGKTLSQSHGPSQPEDGLSSYTSPEIGLGLLRLHGSPGKRRDSSGDSSQRSHLPRSVSESNLMYGQCTPSRKMYHTSRPQNNTVVIPVLPISVEQEVARLMASPQSSSIHCQPRNRLCRKSRSVDSLRGARSGTPNQYSESEGPTRSPSPAASSGVESNSIKDSPMQIDVLSGGDGTSLDLPDGGSLERRSVMAGGSVRGWLPDVAVVLWRRMLGALGDVNQLTNPALHSQVFEYLVELCDTLAKIRLNQGVSDDNQVTPPPPDLIPPLNIIAPWCFKALTLPSSYQKGKLCAYRLLCTMTVTPQDISLPRDHLSQFYKVLHQGLVGTDQAVINTLVQFSGPRFFSLMLPGHSLLLYDFIHAANTIVSSSDLRGTPRTEAVSILGALLCLPNTFAETLVLQPNAGEFTMMPCSDAKDHILSILLKCGKREPAGQARCIALSSLGIYLYQELTHEIFHPKNKEAMNVLLLALRFNNKTVGQVASDILLLLCDHADRLVEHYPEIPSRIIEVLALTLSHLMPQNNVTTSERDKHLLTSLMFCLGEWCMKIPANYLLASNNGSCLLLTVFKVLNQLQGGGGSGSGVSGSTGGLFQPDLVQDFDPNILLDDLKEGSTPPVGRRSSAMIQESGSLSHHHHSNQSIQMAARMVMMHLVNHLGHFPMGIGAARLSSMVVEHDDVPGLATDELSAEVFSAPNIQLFVLSNSLMVSLVELPALEVPGGGITAGLRTAPSQVRIILRDLSGKASWDASILYCSPEDSICSHRLTKEEETEDGVGICGSSKPISVSSRLEEAMLTSSFVGGELHSCPPQHTLRHRPPHMLPTCDNGAEDMDNLDDLLQYLGYTSPECLESLDTPRNIPATPPPPLTREAEEDTITMVLNQRNAEQEYLQRRSADITMLAGCMATFPHKPSQSPFQHCRLLFSQLGLAGWERRSQLHLLSKNEKLLRELRNLDTQRCRETHKIAVVYVAEGQEDKSSILSNTCGSQAYEEFIAGLAWEVELESHTGFLGGLQRNKSTGETAPYYATSFLEVIFHVATRMPSSSQESLLQKTRHLGNDEVHIVWSEHSRDYRRGIIPTEFCDVLIVIYPLPNRLYRVQVSRKSEVPYFGPLFNESIVDDKVLPGLVRASAIGASRAKRSMLPFYQNYYEERAKSLETVVRNHKDATTFEEFTAQVYSPVQATSPFCPGPNRSSGTSLSSRSPEPSSTTASSSTLAAALLDSHQHRYGYCNSNATGQDSRVRGTDGIRVWFANNESASSDTALHGISPRPLKKLSFKTTARRSLTTKSESISLTPPDSPTTRKSK